VIILKKQNPAFFLLIIVVFLIIKSNTTAQILLMFNLMDKHLLSGYISSFGNISSIVFVMISFFKFFLFPLKDFLVIFSGMELFKSHQVFVLYYMGLILSSIICYQIGKLLSNTLFTKKIFTDIKTWCLKFQIPVVFIFSLWANPFLDIIGYLSGLFEFNFKKYMFIRLIAKIPMTLIYISMGQIPNSRFMNIVNLSFFIFSLIVIYIQYKNIKIKGVNH
jgi:uncharacterized membrane protein YdjX (TVP38/TMEM64 family)